MLSQAYQAPSKISLELVRACYLGFSDAPLPEQLPLLKEQLLELATEPGALPLTAMTRPKHQDVSRIHFEFFHLLLALKAFKPLEQEDRHLASKLLELGARFHPDRLSLFATTCTSWPLSVQAVEEILRATEGTLSYRYPPQASDKKELPVTSFTASTDFFEEFRRRYGQGDLADIQLASVAALKRWPRDRRSHLWAGWLNLSSMRAKEALRHFDKGLQVSGWLPYAQLEPRLGKAAAEATLANDLEILKMFVKNHEQSDALLKGRLIHGLLPELTSILDGDK